MHEEKILSQVLHSVFYIVHEYRGPAVKAVQSIYNRTTHQVLHSLALGGFSSGHLMVTVVVVGDPPTADVQ